MTRDELDAALARIVDDPYGAAMAEPSDIGRLARLLRAALRCVDVYRNIADAHKWPASRLRAFDAALEKEEAP